MVSTNKKDKKLLKEIDSRLSIGEQELLCELAKSVPPEHAIIEIANKTSDATEALARGAEIDGKKVYNIPLYSKNNHTDKINICGTENKNGVTILGGSAYDLARYWKDTFGLLVVIGYENYDEVRGAVICLHRYLSSNVVVAVHDRNQPGPARAIKDLLTDLGNYILWQTVDNLTVLVADRCRHYWGVNSNEVGSCRRCGRHRNFKRLAKEATSLGSRKQRCVVIHDIDLGKRGSPRPYNE